MNEPLINGASVGAGEAVLHGPVTPPLSDSPHHPEAPSQISHAKPVAATVASSPFDLVAVLNEHESKLLRYVGHLVDSDADSQDIVQETFLRLHRQVQQHGRASVQSVPAWLARVAHNLATDLVRKKVADRKLNKSTAQRMRSGELPTQETTDHLGDMAQREAMDRALAELNKLPPDQKNILLLRLIQGLKLGEISEATGLTTGNAAYRINQGLNELARRLKASGVI